MSREQELEERKYRRLKRWWDKLPPEKQVPPTAEEMAGFRSQGLVDELGQLTADGRLKLHQLEQLEWMVKWQRRKRMAKLFEDDK